VKTGASRGTLIDRHLRCSPQDPAHLTDKWFDLEISWFPWKPAEIGVFTYILRISAARFLMWRSAESIKQPGFQLVSMETSASHGQTICS
jgi:hypothetical protein